MEAKSFCKTLVLLLQQLQLTNSEDLSGFG